MQERYAPAISTVVMPFAKLPSAPAVEVHPVDPHAFQVRQSDHRRETGYRLRQPSFSDCRSAYRTVTTAIPVVIVVGPSSVGI